MGFMEQKAKEEMYLSDCEDIFSMVEAMKNNYSVPVEIICFMLKKQNGIECREEAMTFLSKVRKPGPSPVWLKSYVNHSLKLEKKHRG